MRTIVDAGRRARPRCQRASCHRHAAKLLAFERRKLVAGKSIERTHLTGPAFPFERRSPRHSRTAQSAVEDEPAKRGLADCGRAHGPTEMAFRISPMKA